jgi:hypothetical protein
MKQIRAWPMIIMTVVAAIAVYAIIVALGTSKLRLEARPDKVAAETAIPATPTAAAETARTRHDSTKRRP